MIIQLYHCIAGSQYRGLTSLHLSVSKCLIKFLQNPDGNEASVQTEDNYPY